MNTLHGVNPEQVMALLDGELSAEEARMVSSHLERCHECIRLSSQLQSTSRVLAAWTVPPVSSKVKFRIQDAVHERNSLGRVPKVSVAEPRARWRGKRWAFAGAVAVPALALALFFFTGVYESLSRQEVAQLGSSQRSHPGDDHASVRNPIPNSPAERQTSKIFTSAGSVRSAGRFAGEGVSHGRGDDQPDPDESVSAPMIARTVSLSLVVKDFAAARAALDVALSRHRGYFARLSISSAENSPRALQASLRVPAHELSSAVADIKALGRLENESQSGEEVTRQYADLLNRLKTARETEQRFRTILQQRTGNLAEVLQVEEEIARVRGDIERMEGEQKSLEHRVEFSTIELQCNEEYKAQLNPPAASVSSRIHNAFVSGYRNAIETILGIVLFGEEYGPTTLIWLIILVLPLALVWKRYRKIAAI